MKMKLSLSRQSAIEASLDSQTRSLNKWMTVMIRPESADPTPEPMVVVPYDPDVVVEEVEEVELEPELASPDEQGQPPPLHELSQGNAMAASATPADPDRDDMFTREELVAAQQAEEAIRVTIEFCKKGEPPDRDEIRAIPEEAKELLLQFETLVVKNGLLYR